MHLKKERHAQSVPWANSALSYTHYTCNQFEIIGIARISARTEFGAHTLEVHYMYKTKHALCIQLYSDGEEIIYIPSFKSLFSCGLYPL